jgi:predicted Zn-dependent peptidase
VERHFGDIARRPAPPQPDLSEPRPSSERRATKADPLAPLPAVAVGYRVPDPINEIDAFAALLVTGEVLAGGEASRLYQRLVKRDRLATHVFALMGTFGDPFDVRDPTMLQFLAYLPPGTDVAAVVQAIDEEVERTASGLSGGDLSRAVTTMVSDYIARLDPLLERSIFSGVLEQQRRRAEWINDLPGVVDAVTADAAAAAAGEWLAPSSRAVLEVVPGAAS